MMENRKYSFVLEVVGRRRCLGKEECQEMYSGLCYQQAKVGTHIGGWLSHSLDGKEEKLERKIR